MTKSISTQQFFLEDIFEEGWRVTMAIFAKCTPIVLFFAFIVNLLSQMAIHRLGLDVPIANWPKGLADVGLTQDKVAGLIGNMFSYLIFSVATLSVIKCAERVVTQREISFGEALAEGLNRWPRYLWAGFLSGLIILVGLCVFIIPGLVWAVYYMFLPYVVSVTSLSGKKALDYSKSLVKGRFWRTIGYFFVIVVATSIPSLILVLCGQTAVNLFASHLPKAAHLAVSSLAISVAQLPVIFQLSLGTVFFLNTAYCARNTQQVA